MSDFFDWDPNRGDPTAAFGSFFDSFVDANRCGLADGETIDGLADTSGNDRRWQGTVASVTQNLPSTAFGAGNAGIQNATTYGVLALTGSTVEGDTWDLQRSKAIPLLIDADYQPSGVALTVVTVAQFDSFAFGAPFIPFGVDGNIDGNGYLPLGSVNENPDAGASNNWTCGTLGTPINSGIAADNDPHLFIVELGTSTSGVEVDGVAGTTGDMSSALNHVPASWAGIGVHELLFFGVLVGTLSDGQKQTIRDWVDANTPITIGGGG